MGTRILLLAALAATAAVAESPDQLPSDLPIESTVESPNDWHFKNTDVFELEYALDPQISPGGSGGGVLTAWIVGNTDRFRAAVVQKPVINWASFVLTSDIMPFLTEYWFSAPPWDDPQQYWRRSPLSLVGNVTTPTMLITGEADWRTPIAESEQFFQALALRKVDTALLRVPERSHNLVGRPSHLIAKADNIIAWFERYRETAKD